MRDVEALFRGARAGAALDAVVRCPAALRVVFFAAVRFAGAALRVVARPAVSVRVVAFVAAARLPALFVVLFAAPLVAAEALRAVVVAPRLAALFVRVVVVLEAMVRPSAAAGLNAIRSSDHAFPPPSPLLRAKGAVTCVLVGKGRAEPSAPPARSLGPHVTHATLREGMLVSRVLFGRIEPSGWLRRERRRDARGDARRSAARRPRCHGRGQSRSAQTTCEQGTHSLLGSLSRCGTVLLPLPGFGA
ncbi:hypothetical protein [Polyangium fumosum]|uniref:Uncharacterized protein n=1 Tax=Polyangium fumosum TaxID=889272 RepID=A0A4U1JED9_9BACT|nr:hypothetical protein [Polyangium fumosum]TKD07880.1 hypothetical protein E8A74_16435 [Polyangium fumosum]